MWLYFDECCSRRLVAELKEFYSSDYPDLQMGHVLDHYKPGEDDSDWLAPLKQGNPPLVITGDRGKNSKKEKLPIVCKKLGVTHVAFTSGLIKAGFSTQKNAIVSVWNQLGELSKLPPGTQVKLGMKSTKGGGLKFELRVNGKSLSSVIPSN